MRVRISLPGLWNMYLAVGLTPARDSTSFAEQGRAPKTGMVFDRSSLMPNRQWLKGSPVRHSFVYGSGMFKRADIAFEVLTFTVVCCIACYLLSKCAGF